MRLSTDQIQAIRQAATAAFGQGTSVWLFGSHVAPELEAPTSEWQLAALFPVRSQFPLGIAVSKSSRAKAQA